MRDPVTKVPRGFGFVEFKDPNVVELVARQEHFLDGKKVNEQVVYMHYLQNAKFVRLLFAG